jgi:predicted ester cyclase
MTNAQSILRKYLAAGDSGDLEALGRFLHDDVILHDPGGSVAVGLQHEKETWRTARAAMPGLRHHVLQSVGGVHSAAARVALSGTLKGQFAGFSADGAGFSVDQAVFITVRDGKASEVWAMVDTGAFYRQVSASPEGPG